VSKGTEVDPPYELPGQDTVEPLELPSPSRIVRPPVDRRDAVGGAVLSELLRDEAAPVVDVEGLGLAAALERPPEIVRGLPGPISEVGAGHHEVPGAIVQDGVNIDVSTDPDDTELVDIHLPEGIDVTPLEPLERLRLLGGPGHDPVAFQHPVDRDPSRPDAKAPQDGVDP
jgi:hypothetical protein